MPYQYDDYCYSTLTEVCDVIQAEKVTFDNTVNKGSMIPVGYIIQGSNVTLNYKVNGSSTTTTSVNRKFPFCSSVGPIKVNTSPLDAGTAVGAFTAGATIVFPAFAIIWAAAFVLNHLKKL